jgi:hypothetical protein
MVQLLIPVLGKDTQYDFPYGSQRDVFSEALRLTVTIYRSPWVPTSSSQRP